MKPHDTGITFAFCSVSGIAGTGPVLDKRLGAFIYHAPEDIHLHHIRGRLVRNADAPCNIVGIHGPRHGEHHQAGGKRLHFVCDLDAERLYVCEGGSMRECVFYDADADVTTSRWAPCEHCDRTCTEPLVTGDED